MPDALPTPGRIVWVRLPLGGNAAGEIRPALVVASRATDDDPTRIYAHVALDHERDGVYAQHPYATPQTLPITCSRGAGFGQWSWPERS